MSTPTSFIDGVLIASTLTTYYTLPDYNKCIIKHFSLHNTSSSRVQVTINLVNTGDTAAVKNQSFKRYIAPFDDRPIHSLIGATLNAKARIQMIADTNNVVSCRAGGNLV